MAKKLSFTVTTDGSDAIKQFAKIASSAKADMRKVEQALEGGESAGKQMAAALSAAAEQIEAEYRGLESASERLASALGPEFAAQAGRGVDEIVMDLRRAGLTFEQIEADAEDLAAAVKRIDDVGLGRVRGEVDRVGDEVRKTSGEIDKSRSVMANFAGNAAQDLPGVAGQFSALNVAAGQFAEYASEGGISLKGFAATLGPMLAIGAAVKGLSTYFGEKAARKAFNAEDVQAWTQALMDGGTALERIKQIVESTGELPSSMGVDLIPILDELGVRAEQYGEMLSWTDEQLAEFVRTQIGFPSVGSQAAWVLAQLKDAAHNYQDGLEKAATAQDFFATGVGHVSDMWQAVKGSADAATGGVGGLTDAFLSNAAGAGAAGAAQRIAAMAAGELARQEANAARALRDYNAAWDALTGELDTSNATIALIEGFDALREAHQATADAAKDGAEAQKAAFLAEGRAVNDQKQRVIDYGREILGLPADRMTEFLAMIDAGRLADVERQLTILSRNRTVSLDIIAKGGVGYDVPVDGRRERGGAVSAGGLYEVAERGVPELLDVGDRTFLMMGARGGMVIPPAPAPGAGASVASGGTTVIQLTLDGRVLTEVVHDGLLAKQRRVPLGFG